MLNWLMFCSFIFALMLTLLGVVVDLTYNLRFQPDLNRLHREQEQMLTQHFLHQSQLNEHPVFRSRPQTGENLAENYVRHLKKRGQESLLSADDQRLIMRLMKSWLKRPLVIGEPPPVQEFFARDFSQFHWSHGDHLPSGYGVDIITASQAHLAYAFHQGPKPMHNALKKTRQLAQILLNSESLRAHRLGLSLLDKEHDVVLALRKQHRVAQIIWTPVSQKDLEAYRHALGEIHNLLSPLTEASILKKVFLHPTQPPLGFCAIIKHKMEQLVWGSQMLDNSFPFEPNFKDSLNQLQQIRGRAHKACHNLPQEASYQTKWVAHLPYIRRIYAVKMILNARKVNEFL